jgi:Uma2 family endonuclease
MNLSIIPAKIRLWNLSEYHHLREKGILHPEEKIELIEGQLIKMSPKGTLHTAATRRIAKTLTNLLVNKAAIYTQDPVELDDNSEPEPDVSIVKIDPNDYVTHHPQTEEIYLIIEVADSSLEYDCEIKAKLYAKSGIEDYWVIDVRERKLYLFRKPEKTGYQNKQILRETDLITPLSFPTISVKISELLPPKI